MNPLNRTVHQVIEHSINQQSVESFLHSNGIKAFQLVKHVTGKAKSTLNDYSIENLDPHYGYDSIAIKGNLGFVRVTLEPLFQII